MFTENTVNMDLLSFPASDCENTCRFFKDFCFCAPCLTIGAVPLLKLWRNRESVNIKVNYSNPVGKMTKTSSSKQVILQMRSLCFSFKDMRSVRI